MLTGSYNPLLVLLSLLVAILASYVALDMAGRISSAQGKAARWWLTGGACAMGLGIWSMHFIGMLAFTLPIPLGYDPAITFLSLLIAIVSSGFGLWLGCRDELPWKRLAGGAMLMGLGIAGMHYTGMAAMRMVPGIDYDPLTFTLSVLIAIVASGAALWLAYFLRRHSPGVRLLRGAAAVVMGFAIVIMHYTGMNAARFAEGSICAAARGTSTDWLALVIVVFTLAVLAIALIVSILDTRLEERTASLSSSLAEANQELAYLALHDNLTKLPNRTLLADRVDQAIRHAGREQTSFALMFLDLDGFKEINDVYGHHIGDELLKEIAQRMNGLLRPQDTLARVGGDEFVLLARVNDAADAATIAEGIAKAVREPVEVHGQSLSVSTSIGIAMYPGNGEKRHDLLSHADAAMYHAKSLGRDAYCFFDPSMQTNAHEKLRFIQELRRAIEENQLVLHYQPQFDAATEEVIGIEALVRWNHPVHGLLSPAEFIPLAEKSGLIVPIGEWVLNEACRQLAQWQREGHTSCPVAVNISAEQFNHPNMIHLVAETLARHELAPRYLMLEITESTAMRDVDTSLAILQQLDQLGVGISIDDFGTGYSSLLYLKRLPASELKIDRGFVRDLASDTEDAAIVSAVVALGQTLNLKIVAEGVETRAQQQLLTQLGCDALQGYLLGRPVPAEQLGEVLRRQRGVPELTPGG